MDQATFSSAGKERAQRLQGFLAEGNGYFQIQATHPQTPSYALTDSPAGQPGRRGDGSPGDDNAARRAPGGRAAG